MEAKQAKIITIANSKGGCSKTTTTFELAHYLSAQGYKVLVLDTDQQSHSSMLLLKGGPFPKVTLDMILERGGRGIPTDAICHCDNLFSSSIDFVSASPRLARIESRLPNTSFIKEYLLGDLIRTVANEYDFILIDTAPAGEMLGLSALIASDYVLIPVTMDMLTYEGTGRMIDIVSAIRNDRHLNPNLLVLGIVVTRYRPLNISNFFFSSSKQKYGGLVVEPPVRECTKISQATAKYQSIFEYAPTCTAARDYQAVFLTLLHRMIKK